MDQLMLRVGRARHLVQFRMGGIGIMDLRNPHFELHKGEAQGQSHCQEPPKNGRAPQMHRGVNLSR